MVVTVSLSLTASYLMDQLRVKIHELTVAIGKTLLYEDSGTLLEKKNEIIHPLTACFLLFGREWDDFYSLFYVWHLGSISCLGIYDSWKVAPINSQELILPRVIPRQNAFPRCGLGLKG